MSKGSEAVKRWRRNTKKKFILAMGNQCNICGYDKCDEALEFHHVDPNEKDITWGSLRANIKSFEAIAQELKKCILICSNCHKEVHSIHSKTQVPKDWEPFNDEVLKQINEGIHESVPKDECPQCGRLKPEWYQTCGLQCGYKRMAVNKIDWGKYDICEMYLTMSFAEIAEVVGCSSGAVSKQIKKILTSDEIKRVTLERSKHKGKQRVVKNLNTVRTSKNLEDKDVENTVYLYNKLKNYEAVGRELGITGAAVKRRLKNI